MNFWLLSFAFLTLLSGAVWFATGASAVAFACGAFAIATVVEASLA